MAQLQGFIDARFPNHVCKLNKALCGLKQAPRAWFDRLKSVLVRWGFKSSRVDSSLFLLITGQTKVFVFIYVDDILVTGNNSSLINRFVKELNREFALEDLGELSYFLGIKVHRDQLGIHQAK